MSCLTPDYNPQPTHVGNRVENRCITDTFNPKITETVYVPYLQSTVPITYIPEINKMLHKGNILQYKKNSSNLTKQQRYSQIAKGLWVNRTKTYATQTQTYTNPNVNYLKRVNVLSNITLTGNTTNLPITCTNNISTLTPSSIVVNNGGVLVCNSIENPGNGVSYTLPQQKCFPTSASNIPLPLTYLCYNTGIPTYYPRQNYTMNTSLSKFPINSKGLCKSANSIKSFNCNL